MKNLYKQIRQTFLICTVLISATGTAQSWQWAKRVGSNGDNAPFTTGNQDEIITDLKVDKAGNIYAVGHFFANPVFNNNQIFGETTPPGFGERDAYLIKYNSCGSTLWWRRMGSTTTDEARTINLVMASMIQPLVVEDSFWHFLTHQGHFLK